VSIHAGLRAGHRVKNRLTLSMSCKLLKLGMFLDRTFRRNFS